MACTGDTHQRVYAVTILGIGFDFGTYLHTNKKIGTKRIERRLARIETASRSSVKRSLHVRSFILCKWTWAAEYAEAAKEELAGLDKHRRFVVFRVPCRA